MPNNIILLNNNACTFSIGSKINKMYECFADTFLLTCHKCHIKTFTREGETRERHAKKVKRQKLYEYTFIISTGYNVKKTMSKLLQDYSSISCLCTSNSLFQMYTLNVERFTMINKSQNIQCFLFWNMVVRVEK